MFIHIDCNSFFASCEVADNPALKGRPVIVANGNEAGGGVILALTSEAKSLGFKRGMPLFKVRQQIEQQDVVVCPADHKKYRRYSRSVMQAVQEQEIVLDFVQYSVDEFFGQLPVEDPQEVEFYTRKVKDRIFEAARIPVGCGCSSTYTLAKTATYFAKHFKAYGGVCVLTADKVERALSLLPVGDVWGIGRQNKAKLHQMGVVTALDFVRRDEREIERAFSTAGLHTYQELKGQPCIRLDRSDRQKSIMQSHTFAYMIADKDALAHEIRGFATRCCARLREQHGLCSNVTLFVATNRHHQDLLQYSNSASVKLPSPTSDTPTVIKVALTLLDTLFRAGYQYKQAGVVLGGISSEEGQQLDLFTAQEDERKHKLMVLTDSINHRFGEATISFGEKY